MEEALLHEVFGVTEDYCSTRTEVRGSGDVFIAVEPLDQLYVCPKCRSREGIGKGQRTRRVQTLPIGFHAVYLEVTVPRCQCNRCRHLFEIAPPFARPTPTTRRR